MTRIEKIKIKDLEWFYNSTRFKELPFQPISSLRVASYVNNPHALPDDEVVFLLFDHDELAAYRTVFADEVIDGDGNRHHVAWFSGNYCHPKHRRKGFSMQLMKAVEESWGGMLLHGIAAPNSQKGYDKSGNFDLLREYEDTRFYRRFILKKILPQRNRKWRAVLQLLGLIDFFGNAFSGMWRGLFRKLPKSVEEISYRDALFKIGHNPIANRGLTEFNWMQEFPWVKRDKNLESENDRYHFSLWSANFGNKLFTIKMKKEQSLLWIVINKEKMFVPYCTASAASEYKELALKTLEVANENDVAFITVAEPQLAFAMSQVRSQYIVKKKVKRYYQAHKTLLENLDFAPDQHFSPYDSDLVFTA